VGQQSAIQGFFKHFAAGASLSPEREGYIGIAAHNTPRMAWAYKTVKKQETGVVRE